MPSTWLDFKCWLGRAFGVKSPVFQSGDDRHVTGCARPLPAEFLIVLCYVESVFTRVIATKPPFLSTTTGIGCAWMCGTDGRRRSVAMEAESHVLNPTNGRRYNDFYHHLFRLKEGQITRSRSIRTPCTCSTIRRSEADHSAEQPRLCANPVLSSLARPASTA